VKNKRMQVSIATDGVEATFYSEPNEDGSQAVAGSIKRDLSAVMPRYGAYLAMRGYADLLSQRLGGRCGAERFEAEQALWASLRDGTYDPSAVGRGGAQPKAPSDFAVALAEWINDGRSAHDFQEDIETRLQVDGEGNPRLDARGRQMRYFTQAAIAKLVSETPEVARIMARLGEERAKRLRADARHAEAGGDRVKALFGGPEPVAAAAQ